MNPSPPIHARCKNCEPSTVKACYFDDLVIGFFSVHKSRSKIDCFFNIPCKQCYLNINRIHEVMFWFKNNGPFPHAHSSLKYPKSTARRGAQGGVRELYSQLTKTHRARTPIRDGGRANNFKTPVVTKMQKFSLLIYILNFFSYTINRVQNCKIVTKVPKTLEIPHFFV